MSKTEHIMETNVATARNPAQHTAPMLQRACTCGATAGTSGKCASCTAAEQLGVQPKLAVNKPGDRYEQEADRIADQVMAKRQGQSTGPLPVTPLVQRQAEVEEEEEETVQAKHLLQRQPEEEEEEEVLQPKRAASARTTPAAPAIRAASAVATGGRPLSRPIRKWFEPRFGRDLGHVRLHTSSAAHSAARNIHAHAYTLRNNIVFAAGQYAPDTAAGRRLLAHELTHVLQQSPAGTIQREEAEPAGAITARDIFPVEQGARLQILRTMEDLWFGVLQSEDAETAATIEAIQDHVAEVTTVNDDLFLATMAQSVQLPARDQEPARTIRNVEIRLARTSDGVFDFTITGLGQSSSERISLYSLVGMTAERRDGSVVLSSEGVPQLGTTATEGGGVAVQAYTAPYLSRIPELARDLAPERLNLISMTRLPEVEAGSPAEQAAIERNAESARAASRTRRQRLTLGAGLIAGEQINPMLEASWQINFMPSQLAGAFAQIPLRVSILYAPTSSVIGQVRTGFEASLSQIDIPINVQVTTGLAGGVTREADIGTGETGPKRPVLGIPLGAGIGVEYRSFRMDLRYDYLINFVEGSPNAHLLGLGLGGVF